MNQMTAEELQAAVDGMLWYHRIPLVRGVVTPGWAPINDALYKVPAALDGKRVLDVGTYDGYWAFEALRRGAREVIAIDNFSDTIHNGEKRSWKQFELCRDALGYTRDQCYNIEMSVYDVTEAALGRFDVVLFFGTLYHCRHPLLALDRLAAVTDELLCVESAICDDYSPYIEAGGRGIAPVMEFFPTDEYGANHTNWWCPTLRCMGLMLAAAGFQQISTWKIATPNYPIECRGYAQGKR